jgi:hypothetical protein
MGGFPFISARHESCPGGDGSKGMMNGEDLI